MASQGSKVQLAPPTGKIGNIQDGRTNSEIGYCIEVPGKKQFTKISQSFLKAKVFLLTDNTASAANNQSG